MKDLHNKLQEENREIYFRTYKGILRRKTIVIDGKQYYKNADLEDLDEITTNTINATIKEITHEWNKAEQRLDGTTQGALNCIEQFRNYLTLLTDNNSEV